VIFTAAISIILSTKGDRPVVSRSTATIPLGNRDISELISPVDNERVDTDLDMELLIAFLR
jgi:hypothetical protein